eukprot:scaffold3764_cov26-Tisochrysis_lutea.AAC.1
MAKHWMTEQSSNGWPLSRDPTPEVSTSPSSTTSLTFKVQGSRSKVNSQFNQCISTCADAP